MTDQTLCTSSHSTLSTGLTLTVIHTVTHITHKYLCDITGPGAIRHSMDLIQCVFILYHCN